jgi:DNA topoisomerase-1
MAEKKYGKEYAESHTYTTKSKNAQEAHEAVRPTHIEKETVGGTPEQKKLYELIWRRTIASANGRCKTAQDKNHCKTKDKKVPQFAANGSRVLFDGWLKADPAARGEDVELPKVTKGEALDVERCLAGGEADTPPPLHRSRVDQRAREARHRPPLNLCSIMKTLADRGYVTKEGRTLMPTDTGDVVSTFLEDNFPTYIGDTFTAEMEDELDDIAEGKREYAKTLKDFYTPFLKEVKIKDKEAGKITDLGPAPAEFTCPVCGTDGV